MGSRTRSVKLRRAENRDAPVIAELSGQLGYAAEVAATARRLRPILASSAEAVFVAEVAKGEIVAWMHVFATRRIESEGLAEIGGLVVASEWRRKGIGRKLVEAAEGWAETKSRGALRVRSNTTREAAHAFYAGMGFEKIKNQAVYQRRVSESDP